MCPPSFFTCPPVSRGRMIPVCMHIGRFRGITRKRPSGNGLNLCAKTKVRRVERIDRLSGKPVSGGIVTDWPGGGKQAAGRRVKRGDSFHAAQCIIVPFATFSGRKHPKITKKIKKILVFFCFRLAIPVLRDIV